MTRSLRCTVWDFQIKKLNADSPSYKQYAKPFENDVRPIYKIGVNFSTKTKRIDGWTIE